jgi:NAD-dependent SIR2 family protein deacetylase
MILSQGFAIAENGELIIPENTDMQMKVPSGLIPVCPDCGREMSMNLRADDTFVEDDGWHAASGRYADFLRRHGNRKVLYLELGVGMNTPVIIKYPFWQYTAQNELAVYACLNMGEAYAPDEIAGRSICINGDIAEMIERI